MEHYKFYGNQDGKQKYYISLWDSRKSTEMGQKTADRIFLHGIIKNYGNVYGKLKNFFCIDRFKMYACGKQKNYFPVCKSKKSTEIRL